MFPWVVPRLASAVHVTPPELPELPELRGLRESPLELEPDTPSCCIHAPSFEHDHCAALRFLAGSTVFELQ